MEKTVFEYRDYKEYLNAWIENQPRGGHGLRSKLAAAVGCNTTYITQVLKGSSHFSLEQGEQAARFIGHSKEETLHLLLLIQYARAGTQDLRRLFEQQIAQAVTVHFDFKKRLKFQKSLSIEDQATYYSSWHLAAIHTVLSIPRLQTREALAEYFGLPMKTVAETLRALVLSGLAIEEKGRYKTGPFSIHLAKDSPMIAKHHGNWRLRAISSIEERHENTLHYSSVITISRADEPRVREILTKAIEEVRAVVRASGEEEAHCYTMDFFPLRKG